jgi:hypothetical protein
MENANHKCTIVSVSIISFHQVRSPVLAAPLPIPSVFYFHIPSVGQLATWGPIGQQFGYMKLKVVKLFGYLQSKEKSFKWSLFFFLALC